MTSYEWVVEALEGEEDDIGNVSQWPTFAEAIQHAAYERGQGERIQIALVRDVHVEDCGLQDRQWAYLEDGKLPERFSDSAGNDASRVPKRFSKEVVNASAAAQIGGRA
jgi:hypothetical protein